MPTMTCPPADRLLAFQAGKLNHNELNEVASHVESCAACLTVLERVSTLPDTLLKELRHPRSQDGFDAEPDCRRAVANAAALLSDATATRDDTADGEPPADLAQRTLGKYHLLEKIGQGGMGTVYKAFHTLLKRTVALKVLPPNRLKDPQAVSRFRREIEAAGRLDHPHIVRTSDADEAEGQHFLVMEWLAGQDLAKYVRERGPLPIEEACDFIRQAALGLACAHEHGMVHRDVKPSNLLVTTNTDGTPRVKVLDLGLALLQTHDSTGEDLTSADRVMGTYDYLAPEQAMNAHEVDARADIYSLGCTFYYLLAARAPFQGKSETQKLLAHQREQPTPIAQFRANAPREVVAVMNKMMAKDPAHRFASMSEVADAIQKALAANHSSVTKTLDAAPKPRRRGPLFAAAAALLVLLIGGVALYPQIIIRIKGKDGDIDLKLPKGVGVDILKDNGKIASIPGDGKPAKDDTKKPSSDAKDVKKDGDKKADDKQKESPPAGEIRRYLGHKDKVGCVAFSPDGKSFLSGSWGELWLWDVDSTTERVRIPDTHANILSAVFSQDGERVIGSPKTGVVAVWEAKPGEKVRELASFTIPGWTEWLMPSPDRPHLFYTNRSGARIFDLDKKMELPMRFLGERGSLSKNGRRLLSADLGTLYLWDVDTGKELSNVPHPGAIYRVALAPDGRHALASVDKKVYQWDMDEKKPGKTLEGPASVLALAISPDGKCALTGGHDKKMRLWDLQTGTELYCFDGHTGPVISVAFAPDGLQALSGSDDKTIRLWQLPALAQVAIGAPKQNDQPIQTIEKGAVVLDITTKLGINRQVEIRDVGFSGPYASVLNELLFSRTDTTQFRKTGTGETGLGRICLEQGIGVYVFIPIRQIASIEAEGMMHVLTLTDGSTQKGGLLTKITAKNNEPHQLSDAKTVKVITSTSEKPADTKMPTSLLTQAGSSYRLSSYAFHSGRHGFGQHFSMTVGGSKLEPKLSDFDKVVVTANADGNWRIAVTAPGGQENAGILETDTARGPRWYLIGEMRNGWLVLLANFPGNPGFALQKIKQDPAKAEHSDGVVHLAISRDGTKVLTYTSDNFLWFWEWDADKNAFRPRWKKKQDRGGVQSISLDPSGSQALVSEGANFHLSSSPLLNRLDTETEQIQSIRPGIERCGTVAISPDGRRYLVGDPEGFGILVFPKSLDKNFDRFGPAGELLRKFTINSPVEGNKNPVYQFYFSSDGERILSNGNDHTVRLWNSTAAEELKKLPRFAAAKKRFIALAPDGKQALVSQDREVQIWDLHTGKSIRELKGHNDHVTAVAYGPNGIWAVSASRDKTLRVWDAATGKELAKLEGHEDDVTGVAVTSEGRIISASRDKSLRVWAWPK